MDFKLKQHRLCSLIFHDPPPPSRESPSSGTLRATAVPSLPILHQKHMIYIGGQSPKKNSAWKFENQANGQNWKNIFCLDNSELKYLLCYRNELSSLDVSDNLELEILGCGDKLSSLDISKNTSLTHLGCSDNPLSSIDLSNNSLLELFTCNFSLLTSLNVSNNPELLFLEITGNQITSLDVSNNTKLEELHWSDAIFKPEKHP